MKPTTVHLEFEIGEDVVRLVMSPETRPPLFKTSDLGNDRDPKKALEGTIYELVRDWDLDKEIRREPGPRTKVQRTQGDEDGH